MQDYERDNDKAELPQILVLPPRTQLCSIDYCGAHHEGSTLTQSLVLHSPAKQIKKTKTTPYISLMLTRAGAVVCYTLHGTRHMGRQPAPRAGFELAAYYFWHSSSHFLSKMTKLLAKVLKSGQIPSYLINYSPILSSSLSVFPSLISSP